MKRLENLLKLSNYDMLLVGKSAMKQLAKNLL